MKTQILLVIAVVCALVAGVSGIVISLRLRSDLDGANKKIEHLLDQIAELDYDLKAKSASTKERNVENDEVLENRMRSIMHRLATLESGNEGAARPFDGSDDAEQEYLSDDFEDSNSELDTEKRGRKKNRTKFLTMEQVSDELSLDANQQTSLAQAVDNGRERIFDLAQLAVREDPDLKKKIRRIIKSKATPKEKIRRLSHSLARQKPPGEEGSYFDSLKQIRNETAEEVKGILNADQIEKAKAKRMNFMMLKTGYFKNKRASVKKN